MNSYVAFGLGVVAGLAVMGALCDWILVEAQDVLRRAKSMEDSALRMIVEKNAQYSRRSDDTPTRGSDE